MKNALTTLFIIASFGSILACKNHGGLPLRTTVAPAPYGAMSPNIVTSVTPDAPSTSKATGGIGDGGGQGVICRNPDGTIASAEMLDLFEAENYFMLTIQAGSPNRGYLEIAHGYSATLDATLPIVTPSSKVTTTSGGQTQTSYGINSGIFSAHVDAMITSAVDEIDKSKLLIPGHVKIPAVGDSHPLVLPAVTGCEIEQVAVYTDPNNEVHVIKDIWEKMDDVNKAALLLHEALYRNFREAGDTSSDRARKMLGYLFGGQKFQWLLKDAPLEKVLMCWTTDAAASFRFAVYPDQNDAHRAVAQFLIYNGQTMQAKTTISVPMLPFEKPFGLDLPRPKNNSPYGEALMNIVNNPLVETPSYDFGISYASGGQILSTTIQASPTNSFSDVGAIPIACDKCLSSYVVSQDGRGVIEGLIPGCVQ